MNINFNINLTSNQQKAYDLFHQKETKELLLLFSRQQGKTIFAELMIMETALKYKNATIVYISPLYTQGKKVYREIISCLEPHKLIEKKDGSSLTITLFNKTIIQFFTTLSPTAIRGTTCTHLLVLDEAAFFPEKTSTGEDLWYNIIQPITKTRKPKILYISTPNGKRGIFYKKYLQSQEEQDIKCVKADIYSDSFISKEEIDKIKQEIPPLVFDQEYLCKFLDSPLTVFKGFETQFKKIKSIDKNEICWIGIDLSSVGNDRTVVSIINKSNNVEQYVIEGELDEKYKKIANIINSYNKLQKCYIETNGIGSPMINEIKKLVKYKNKIVEWVTTNNSKSEIIGILQTYISNKDIWFDENNTLLYKEMGIFTYKISNRSKVIFSAPEGQHDDTVMSLAIALKAKEDIIPLDVQKDVHFIRTRVKNIG